MVTSKNEYAAQSDRNDEEYDIVIVGGGMVGASLAIALKPSRYSVLLVESVPHQSENQPSYDERTVALTHSAKLIFSAMGVWDGIERSQAEPILDIHISNRGHFGQAHLSHADAGTAALGYVVPTRVIGNTLWSELEKNNGTKIFCPATVQKMKQHSDHCRVDVSVDNTIRRIKSRLVVLADGGKSPLTRDFISDSENDSGVISQSAQYTQSAILSIVTTDRPHNGRAYERFTEEGPLALLPHRVDGNKAAYALVWTSGMENVEARMALSDDDFLAELQFTFGDRAGNFSNPSARKCYPLNRTTLQFPARGRVIVIGNAAHTVHPVAGQGFNLGLRDVAVLAELVHESPDLGCKSMINTYLSRRKRDTEMVSGFTHSLIQIFSSDWKSIGFARNLGLKVIEHSPMAKRFLLKRTMGLAGPQSKLALGIPLDKHQSGFPE
jgi:2-octaprenyl-6-methoxyphenol hydroxylase